MRIIWSPTSRRKLEEIVNNVSSYDTGNAITLIEQFEKQVGALTKGAASEGDDSLFKWVRELIIRPHYLVIYEVRKNRVFVLTVRRTRQEYEENK